VWAIADGGKAWGCGARWCRPTDGDRLCDAAW
jgi:hypothetical protein